MKSFDCFSLPLVLAAGLCLPALVHSQPATPEYSRVALPSNLDALLRARLMRSDELDRLKDALEMLKQVFPPDQFRKLQDDLAKQLNDPQVTPQELRDKAQQFQEALRKQLNIELPPNFPEFKNIQPNVTPQSIPTPVERKPQTTPAELPRFDAETNETLIEMVRDLIEDLKDQRWANGLVDSDAFRDFVADLSGNTDWNLDLGGKTDKLNLPWLPRKLPRLDGGMGLDFIRNLPTPQLPDWRVSLPQFRGFNLRMPRFPRITPRFGGIGSPTGGAVIWIVVWVFAVGVLWWVFTKALGRSPLALLLGDRARDHRSGAALGAMPAELATRGDVIRAFEILAQKQMGPEVRTWNHRAVARAWGSEPGNAFARLYEMARYTPGDGPLSGDERARAERALAQLRGGAA